MKKMNRKDFLKSMGIIGVGSAVPMIAHGFSAKEEDANRGTCNLIPSETAGPFPLDLTANTYYFRQDVREGKAGVQLNLKIKINGIDNCLPMQNVRVNIWHCDKDGYYSGYDNNMNPGQAGQTYLRGYQITDANGEVDFITIFPGWYSGRICHIHFQVHVSSSYSVVSQLSFDIATKNLVYSNNSSIYTKGADPMTFSNDNIFSDGYSYQLASLTQNSNGDYDAYLEVNVQGTGAANTTNIGHIEKENLKQFELGQNYPNPVQTTTYIPFTVKKESRVLIELFNLNGQKVAELTNQTYGVGEYKLDVDFSEIGVSSENMIYQFTLINDEGTFKDHKMITVVK